MKKPRWVPIPVRDCLTNVCLLAHSHFMDRMLQCAHANLFAFLALHAVVFCWDPNARHVQYDCGEIGLFGIKHSAISI